MKTIQTVIRTVTGYRGAILRNGLVVVCSVNAWSNRNAAAIDAYKLARAV